MTESKEISLEPDVTLMLRASKGDAEAYGRLYKKHFSTVECFARQFNGQMKSSQDIAQETFRIIWEKRKQYRPAAAFKTYLLAFARNIVLEHQRRHRYERLLLQNYPAGMKTERTAVDIAAQNKELLKSIAEAQNKLSEKQLQAIELVFYSNIPISEAAKLAGCSYTAFCARIKDSKKHLASLLEQF